VTPSRLVAAVGLAALLTGCAGLSAADKRPRTDPVARLVPVGPSPWREDLGDPVLADLLRRADAGGLDVKAALARLERADAEVEAGRAPTAPHVTVGAAVAVGGGTFHESRSAGTPTLGATYEADLWRRYARARDAAKLERQAAADDVEAARLLAGAETVRAYTALRAAQAGAAAASRRQALAQRALELVRHRADEGAALPEEVSARLHDLAAARAAAQTAETETALQAARLGDLTGQRGLTLPAASLPPVAAAAPGAPSDKVDGRPDVQAAFARLKAADARRASAVAAARPQFVITAALGQPDPAIATLLDIKELAWAAAGALSQEVLDGGAKRAAVHAASAEADLADIAYRQAVVTAWSDVRAALAADAAAQRQLDLAGAQLDTARAALQTGERRHAAGALDGLAIAGLQAAVETAEDGVREAQAQAAEARVRRALAMGGR
jgi:multidrug efflux system outer membrane protein